MKLYRLTYLRDRKECHITFAAAHFIEASLFRKRWEKQVGAKASEMEELPPNRFIESPFPRGYPVRQDDGATADPQAAFPLET